MSRPLLSKLKATTLSPRLSAWIVVILRLIVGATFIMSGLAKCIDIWGFTFKIGEYVTVWGLQLPQTLFVIAAMGLSIAEFVLGAMLLLGCYKRSASWLLLAIMCGMLPLSLYIFVASPVADCGCFGDFWVISNGATFLKNIFLTAALIFLAVKNKSVGGVFRPYSQWVVATACFVYAVAVALWGYNVQPLVDFRSFPIGSQLISADDEDSADDDIEFQFIYEKNGEQRTFGADELPDSTWTFVDREIIGDASSESKTELAVYDDGEDVTQEVVATEGPQLIIVVPDYRRAGISGTFAINELHHVMDSIGGSMIEVAAIPREEIERWRDLSMADYPIYQAEPTVLKELSRGVISAVFIRDGRIVWKRTVPSIDLDSVVKAADKNKAIESLAIDSGRLLDWWTLGLLGFMLLVWVVDFSIGALHNRSAKKPSDEKVGEKD